MTVNSRRNPAGSFGQCSIPQHPAEYGRVNQPKLIRDAAIKQKVLEILESVARGIERLEAILKRTDPNTAQALAKVQAPPLGQIAQIGRAHV